MIDFGFSNEYRGEGISEGLERGLVVSYNDINLVQEGMGLGASAIKSKTSTYFSRKSKLIKLADAHYIKEFYIDSELKWKILPFKGEGTKTVNPITFFINKLTDFYKRAQVFQPNLLQMGIFSRNFFQVKPVLINTGYLGKMTFDYELDKKKIVINADFSDIIKRNGKYFTKICILNELGGDYFDSIKQGTKVSNPPSGWVKINSLQGKKLYSSNFGLTFIMDIIEKGPNCRLTFTLGREKISNFCWAGFGIEVDVKSIKSEEDHSLKYRCEIHQDGGESNK